jgi:pyruvate-formate lyase-activating enzyme
MTKFNIQLSRVEYVTSEMALKLYTQGCKVQCPGCNRKEYWAFKKGSADINSIEECLINFDMAIKKIVITGGEPLQQELTEFIKLLRFLKGFKKEIWILTSLNMHDVYPGIRDHADFIKTGIFDPLSGPGREEHGYKLSSKNQKVWKRGEDY